MEKSGFDSFDIQITVCYDDSVKFNNQSDFSGLTELLAPAGSFDAALAAFQYGADAVYLGLSRHSARAEAVNFTAEELKQIVAYAHSLERRRAVYVAINTLLSDEEIAPIVSILETVRSSEADGVIIQDLAVYSIIRNYFPDLVIHASTQMCVHNIEGARAMKEMGFSRVVFARELTLAEIADIADKVDIETEVFIQGALCYGYSGHCLFSALSTGRSGNRGRCAYCCRERFSSIDGKKSAFPFSMRDLSIRESVLDLRKAGVTSLKIEGRMKSPLYVAAATHLYRLILDGKASREEINDAASDLESVFSRPSTRLYLDGRNGDNNGIIDAGTVGHRGTPVGKITSVKRNGKSRLLSFTANRDIQVHDGLQIDLPGRPYGFAVDRLYLKGEINSVFTAHKGSKVEIELPQDAPILPVGATVFCSSSQAVHQKFSIMRPRQSGLQKRESVDAEVTLEKNALKASAIINGKKIEAVMEALLTEAKNPGRTYDAVQKAFGRTGESNWRIEKITLNDRESLYAPPSLLNELRRMLCSTLDETAGRITDASLCDIAISLSEKMRSEIADDSSVPGGLSIEKSIEDNPERLDCAEVILKLTNKICLDTTTLIEALNGWREKNAAIRVSLPLIVREEKREAALSNTISFLIEEGVKSWECADMASLYMLKRLGAQGSFTAASSFYAFNKIAAHQLRELGIGAAVIPAELDDNAIKSIVDAAPDFFIVPTELRPPMFISETKPVVPWETQNNYTISDRRGTRYNISLQDGLWYTRKEEKLVHPLPKNAVRWRIST